MTPQVFFDQLWHSYVEITPQADKIRNLFLATDAEVINDHVAFRTFANSPIELDNLEPFVLAMGYQVQADYDFEEKKLRARSFIHPDSRVPKIFISELQTHKLSPKLQAILGRYMAQIQTAPTDHSIFWSGRHWETPSLEDYQAVVAESEYGAWLLTIGLCVNHFTVSVEQLTSTNSLQEVLDRVKAAGFATNQVGGEIKGSPEECLEQGSSMADKQAFVFAGGEQQLIPTCFYEFAKRYPDHQGNLYQGFIAASADKIFESTFTAA